jgi:hypothetical protein
MVQFNLEHAIQLRNSIASFQAIYSEEWLDLIQRLQDLQQVWHDTHRLDFEQDFHNLTSIHQQIDQELEHHLQELDRTTDVIEKLKEQLIHLSETSTLESSIHNKTSSISQANNQTSTNSTPQNSLTFKQEVETIIDRFPNLYKNSIASFQSLSKNSVSAFSVGLVIFAMANGIYNFQGVKFFEAAMFPKTVIQTPASDCDEKSENKVSFNRFLSLTENIADRERRASLDEHYEHLTEDGLEKRKKKKEDEEKEKISRQQRQQAQTSAPK